MDIKEKDKIEILQCQDMMSGLSSVSIAQDATAQVPQVPGGCLTSGSHMP
jgi:hypothetical protein